MGQDIIRDFPVTVYGNFQKYSEVISRGRCRLFYLGENRNHSFITPEFATKLLSTIAYTPLKGIYDDIDDDYTDHGMSRTEGRIYGVVPSDYNLQWEKHLDSDGIEREYACVDVLIYTALYNEANDIIGKSQSMELYDKSVKGSWQEMANGERYFVFEDACFLGLQVLGNEVEPCFEGASFFSLCHTITDLTEAMEQYQYANNCRMGGKKMQINFRLSDNQKFSQIWSMLNPQFSEEGNWTVDYDICEVYDDYALVKNYAENKYERVYYTKNENDEIVIGEREECFIVDVNSNEKQLLQILSKHDLNDSDAVNAHFEEFELAQSQISENRTQFTELTNKIDTLNIEKEQLSQQNLEFTNKLNELQQQYDAVIAEKDVLANYKKNIELNEKKTILNNYVKLLSEDVINNYSLRLDEFNAQELDMNLTYEAKKSNPNIFNMQSEPFYVPKEQPLTGLAAILSVYEKNKRN